MAEGRISHLPFFFFLVFFFSSFPQLHRLSCVFSMHFGIFIYIQLSGVYGIREGPKIAFLLSLSFCCFTAEMKSGIYSCICMYGLYISLYLTGGSLSDRL